MMSALTAALRISPRTIPALRQVNTAGLSSSVQSLYYSYVGRRRRRVLFNVPGSDERKIRKAATELTIDSVVLDFEDGVAPNMKEEARKMTVDWLNKKAFGQAEKCVRINSIGSGLEGADMTALVSALRNLDAIVLPKVEDPSHIRTLANWLDSCGPSAKHVKILAAIESAQGFVRLKEICSEGSDRLDALIFASEDLCADIGITRTPHATELLYYRSKIVTYAAAYGLQPIDMVCIEFRNEAQLIRETEEGARMGFTGKQAIHPGQIDVIYKALRPPEQQVVRARAVVDGYLKHLAEGKGALDLDGEMIDLPMYKGALRILTRVGER